MQIEIKLDKCCTEPRIIVITDELTEELNNAIQILNGSEPKVLLGYMNETAEILNPEEIIRIYSECGSVYAQTERNTYKLKLRLYEAEERLDKSGFVRISNSEIVNIKRIRKFDLSLTGTICVALSNGTVTYVSRRYMSKIKKTLGL